MIGLQVGARPCAERANKWSARFTTPMTGKNLRRQHGKMQGDNAAKVEGCVLGFLCKGQTGSAPPNLTAAVKSHNEKAGPRFRDDGFAAFTNL